MVERLNLSSTPLTGLFIVRHAVYGDSRGQFERMFCATELAQCGFAGAARQSNRTLTRKRGTVRGMHFQHPPFAETKLVRCLRGRVFDVAVDLRANSPTFLSWHGEILDCDEPKSLLIGEGFAHGFQTLSDDCEMLYFHSRDYAPHAEGGVNPMDPRLAIPWPEPVTVISERDDGHALLDGGFRGLRL